VREDKSADDATEPSQVRDFSTLCAFMGRLIHDIDRGNVRAAIVGAEWPRKEEEGRGRRRFLVVAIDDKGFVVSLVCRLELTNVFCLHAGAIFVLFTQYIVSRTIMHG
jgi:hypothetical protein